MSTKFPQTRKANGRKPSISEKSCKYWYAIWLEVPHRLMVHLMGITFIEYVLRHDIFCTACHFSYFVFLLWKLNKKIHGIRKRCKCCIAIWSINTCPVTQKPCAEPYVTKVVGTAFFSYSIELVNDAVFIATQGRTLEYLVTWRDRKVLIRKGQQSFPMTIHMTVWQKRHDNDSLTTTAWWQWHSY